MKVFIITSLIEGDDFSPEVNILDVTTDYTKAKKIISRAVQEAKEMYKEVELTFETETYSDDGVVIFTIDEDDECERYNGQERIEFNIIEKELN